MVEMSFLEVGQFICPHVFLRCFKLGIKILILKILFCFLHHWLFKKKNLLSSN